MPGDRLDPDDLLPPADPRIAQAIARALREHELQRAGVSAFNAEIEAQQATDNARLQAEHRAFEAGFVGPPLPRGYRARVKREKVRRAELRALLKRMREG